MTSITPYQRRRTFAEWCEQGEEAYRSAQKGNKEEEEVTFVGSHKSSPPVFRRQQTFASQPVPVVTQVQFYIGRNQYWTLIEEEDDNDYPSLWQVHGQHAAASGTWTCTWTTHRLRLKSSSTATGSRSKRFARHHRAKALHLWPHEGYDSHDAHVHEGTRDAQNIVQVAQAYRYQQSLYCSPQAIHLMGLHLDNYELRIYTAEEKVVGVDGTCQIGKTPVPVLTHSTVIFNTWADGSPSTDDSALPLTIANLRTFNKRNKKRGRRSPSRSRSRSRGRPVIRSPPKPRRKRYRGGSSGPSTPTSWRSDSSFSTPPTLTKRLFESTPRQESETQESTNSEAMVDEVKEKKKKTNEEEEKLTRGKFASAFDSDESSSEEDSSVVSGSVKSTESAIGEEGEYQGEGMGGNEEEEAILEEVVDEAILDDAVEVDTEEAAILTEDEAEESMGEVFNSVIHDVFHGVHDPAENDELSLEELLDWAGTQDLQEVEEPAFSFRPSFSTLMFVYLGLPLLGFVFYSLVKAVEAPVDAHHGYQYPPLDEAWYPN